VNAPRFAALRQSLAARGVPVDQVMVNLDDAEPMVWLHVVPPWRPAMWLGVAGQMVVPEWSRRTLLALFVVGAAVVGVSWGFTRRLTRPLERLRERIATHRPGESPRNDAPASTISPEIVAIDAAYSDLLARLQRHERERSVLLAGVSHDLRGPLGRIRMAAGLMPDTPELAPRKASIERNVIEADQLIESFLDHVRAGELPLAETVDLAATARAVVAGFERSPDQLSIDAPASLAWPNANRLLVERLLANLIDNALKHGGLPVRVTISRDAAQASIDVSDAGSGFAPETVARLQEAFTRGDASRSAPGSGLGLAIVRQVATRLGGTLAFDRIDGRHRVRVSLPARDFAG
jgi:two-component system osmolarity sensor histidine kinase EnvZ